MRTRPLTVLSIAGLTACVAASLAIAAGPTPPFSPDGVLSPNGKTQYVATAGLTTTVVQAVRVQDAVVLRSTKLNGNFGIPEVAYDGAAGGLTHDGKLLVLVTNRPTSTGFAVLATKNLKVQQSFTLRGTWGYDATSPEGKTLYLIQSLNQANGFHYLVRAYDLQRHKLVKGAIADKSEPGAMTGLPMSRATSASGRWAYTLYQRTTPGGKPFIHALDTVNRVAICIDLNDWNASLADARLTLSSDETQLIVKNFATGKTLMTVAAPR